MRGFPFGENNDWFVMVVQGFVCPECLELKHWDTFQIIIVFVFSSTTSKPRKAIERIFILFKIAQSKGVLKPQRFLCGNHLLTNHHLSRPKITSKYHSRRQNELIRTT